MTGAAREALARMEAEHADIWRAAGPVIHHEINPNRMSPLGGAAVYGSYGRWLEECARIDLAGWPLRDGPEGA